jgi:hypothetical protein
MVKEKDALDAYNLMNATAFATIEELGLFLAKEALKRVYVESEIKKTRDLHKDEEIEITPK